MDQPGERHVDEAVASMLAVLGPRVTRDWDVPAGGLAWSCRETAVHVGHDLLAYTGQVVGTPPAAYLPFDLAVRDTATPREVLDIVWVCGRLLRAAVAAAGPEARGWHWGPTDPAGFAALGVNEVLVHTVDIARGLGVDWRPPVHLCAAVLDRLFPDAPPGDAVDVLLWCTGRDALPDRPRRTSWVLKAALPHTMD